MTTTTDAEMIAAVSAVENEDDSQETFHPLPRVVPTPEEVARLYTVEDFSIAEIAAKTGHPYSRIRRLLRESGTDVRGASDRLVGRTRGRKPRALSTPVTLSPAQAEVIREVLATAAPIAQDFGTERVSPIATGDPDV